MDRTRGGLRDGRWEVRRREEWVRRRRVLAAAAAASERVGMEGRGAVWRDRHHRRSIAGATAECQLQQGWRRADSRERRWIGGDCGACCAGCVGRSEEASQLVRRGRRHAHEDHGRDDDREARRVEEETSGWSWSCSLASENGWRERARRRPRVVFGVLSCVPLLCGVSRVCVARVWF